jgi:hypothetical protein
LRRIILAFATRTASVLGDGFFDSGVLVCAPAVGIPGSSGVAAIEPCSTGCMLIGPVNFGLLFGIMDNARLPGSFDARQKASPARTPRCSSPDQECV